LATVSSPGDDTVANQPPPSMIPPPWREIDASGYTTYKNAFINWSLMFSLL